MYDCKMVSLESEWQRVESSQPKYHDDHIAGKGFTSMSQNNLEHKFIPMPQAMKIPDAKAAVDNGKSFRQFQHEIFKKSRARRK